MEKLSLRSKNNSLMMKVLKRISHLQGMKILGKKKKKKVLKLSQVPH